MTVTKNGYDAFVVMQKRRVRGGRFGRNALTARRLLARMTQAEAEYASGRYADGRTFTERMRRRIWRMST